MGGSRPVAPPPGWYGDPTGRAELRFWTGQEWAPWVWDGTTVAADLHLIRPPLNRSDLDHLEFIDRVFLPEARAIGQITPNDDAILGALLRQLTAEARGVVAPSRAEVAPVTTPVPAPAVTPTPMPAQAPAPAQAAPTPTPTPPQAPGPTPGPGPTPAALPQPAVSPWRSEWTAPAQTPHPTFPSVAGGVGATGAPPARVQALRPAPEQVQRTPDSAFSRWWARSVQTVGSDLAVHGFAYLGVVLFFVGVFGLVVFAFGDVTPGLRPVAEFVIALAPFVAGAMLLRRQAVTVGRALEVLGGVLLPIMILTSFVDDVAFPPDVHGILLVVILTVLTALIAAAYAWWSNRRERSALRYLVAPIAWLAVAMATLGLGRAVPVGKGVVDWKAVFTAAKTGGVKNYFVELEEDPSLMPLSVPYLKSLNV